MIDFGVHIEDHLDRELLQREIVAAWYNYEHPADHPAVPEDAHWLHPQQDRIQAPIREPQY